MSAVKLWNSINYYFKYRKRFERIPGFAEFYEAQNQKLAVTSVRVLLMLGVVLYSAVGLVDYALYPDLFPLFAALRTVFAVVTLTSLLLTLTEWGRRHALHMIFFSALLGELFVSVMISQLSGWTSVYFVGNIIITTAMTMFIPWRPRVGFIYCTLSLVGYVYIVHLYHPFSIEMLIPLTFIFINSLNAFISSLGSELGRMTQWASLLKIETQHEELIRLNETKERFFANISHELRTPLTLVIGPLGALAKRGGGWVSQELVASMVSNAQRLLRQVNSLLDLGKIDSQEMKVHLEVGNLKELILDLHRACAPSAYERHVKLEVQVPQALPNSKFDFEKVETVLANLISNAIKFTPEHGRILLSCELLANGVVRLGVKDTGPGIPLDERAKVFERFHQVDSTVKKVSKGTGLGLSVAKELTLLLGGKIWFESALGEGTSFFVELPFVPTEQPLAHTQESGANAQIREDMRNILLSDMNQSENVDFTGANISEENRRRMKSRNLEKPIVLYVDDSSDLRQYVDSILGSYYTVILAEDGERGFKEALTHNPNLILSDVMMPKMDGFEFCNKIRSDAKLKSVPFVLLTANSSLDAKIEGLEGGADDYLAKPFSERELIARIRNLISLQEKTQALKKQMEAAKRLQLMLLPPMTQTIQGVKIEAIYKASDELSGDFFDTLAIGKWIYVYLAEVGGHGIAAAQITYLVREIFKNALVGEIELNVLFDVVRRAYVERYPEFDLSVQLMRINSVSGDVEYLRSHAANPVVVNQNCETEEIQVPLTSAISPLMSPSKYKTGEVSRFRLDGSSKLYCYSDGAYRFKFDATHEFGATRLLRSFAGTHVLAWPDGLVGTLQVENHDDLFPDDVTILRIGFSDKNRGMGLGAPKMGSVQL